VSRGGGVMVDRFSISSVLNLFRWTTVRGFGNVKYFNVSYFVLFTVLLLFEFYEKGAPVMKFFGASQVFPLTLRAAYAASFMYAVAIALYQYFCPREIKRFGNLDEYVESQYEIFLRAQPHHKVNIVLSNLELSAESEERKRISEMLERIATLGGNARAQAEIELNERVNLLHGDAVQRYLIGVYEDLNTGKPLARCVSFLLYCAGSLVLLTLLLIRTGRVLGG
jgi:hypothetical protein